MIDDEPVSEDVLRRVEEALRDVRVDRLLSDTEARSELWLEKSKATFSAYGRGRAIRRHNLNCALNLAGEVEEFFRVLPGYFLRGLWVYSGFSEF